MKSIGILWNSVNDFRNEVIDEIKKYCIIEDYYVVDFKDNIESFIWDVYGREPEIVIERVNEKIRSTVYTYDDKKVTIIIMDVPNDLDYIKQIKKEIRTKYSKKVDYYSYDNIFHMTENEQEYNQTLNAIKNNAHLKDVIKLTRNR